jgi:hypothetical protein
MGDIPGFGVGDSGKKASFSAGLIATIILRFERWG